MLNLFKRIARLKSASKNQKDEQRILKPIGDLNAVSLMPRSIFENTCRNYIFSSYLGGNITLCRILSRLKIYVDGRDVGITPHLIMDGFWESWITQLMARIIQPGFVCIDVGANLGYFSVVMSELCHGGESGVMVAAEPNPSMCRLLKMTESVNARSFKVVEKAISSYNGEAVLTIPNDSFGGATIKANNLTPSNHQATVSTIRLDDLVAELNLVRVDMIKIDVEGEEPAVFEGMQQTLKNNPQIQIIMEYTPSNYGDKKESFTQFIYHTFNIHLILSNAEVRKIDKDSLKKLMEIDRHTDFYMTLKTNTES